MFIKHAQNAIKSIKYRQLSYHIKISAMNDSAYQQNGGMLEDCVFPFRYEYVLYDQCTQADSDKPWCATLTDEDDDYVEGYWKNCSSASTISTAISATASIEASSIDRGNTETSTISSSIFL